MNQKSQLMIDIERKILASEPLIIRVFLSWKTAVAAVVLGLSGISIKAAQVMSDVGQLNPTNATAIGLAGLVIASFGVISLISTDWDWGK